MKLWNKCLLMAATLMVAAGTVAQTKVGYTNSNLSRNAIYRFGKSEKQGMAIYIDAEKAAMLKGATVKSFLTYVSTVEIENGKFFITKELGGTPLCELGFKPTSSREKMTAYSLNTPYVLDGEPFYVGHVLEASTAYKPLTMDQSQNTEAGISWAYEDGEWMDISNKGIGVPNIQIALEGVKGFTDLMVKPLQPEGYLVAEKPQVLKGQVFNFGTETITSMEVSCKLGDAEPIETKLEGLSLKSGATYDFTLPEYLTEESGNLDLQVSVSKVNGVEDADMTDNQSKTKAYFYPAGIEKKILIEAFTGQACGNCPTGHANLANAMKGIEDEFIEVAHHSGFNPDIFTMAEDYTYTWLFGAAGTFAPGLTFNRTLIPEVNATSVVFSALENASVRTAVQALRNRQPYVDVKMYNEFDEKSRQGKVTIDVFTYVEPSDSIHTLNVWLTQDNMISFQNNGGAEYTHNHVFRGALNSAWGQQVKLEAGKSVRATYEYAIPEEIASTMVGSPYYGKTFAAVPADMSLVAFVSDFSYSSPLACQVYNAAKIPVLTNNMADGVDEKVKDAAVAPAIAVSGNRVNVKGGFAQAQVYNLTGRMVKEVNADEPSFELPAGIYLVRIERAEGEISAHKLIVR